MAQPVSNFTYTYIGTVGSVLLYDSSVCVHAVLFPGTYVGTVMLYDAAAAAGTAATNVVGTIGLPGLNTPSSAVLDLQTKKGLVYTATGTPNVTLVWG